MLCGHGMLKSRCCVLLSELKLFLLRPPAPTGPMSGQTNRIPPFAASDNSNTLRAHRLRHWSTPSTEDSVGLEAVTDGSGWTGTAEDLYPVADEFSMDRRDERFSFISYAEGTPVCRICFQGPEQGELLSPCRCSGSVRSTHHPCLIKWISERGSWTCELCYYKYQVIAISTKNPLQWHAISLTVIEKVQIAAAILGSLFLIASISWLVWSSLSPSAKWQRQDLLFQICYGMYGFMDVVCIALIVHEGPAVFRIFHRWQAVNQQWKVLNYDKMRDSEELKKSEELTRSLIHQGEQTREDISPSSLLAAAGTPVTVTTATTHSNAAGPDSTGTYQSDGAAPPEQHCPYNILHLWSHLRPHEPWSPVSTGSTNTNKPRELVMRVTTV
ncbi:E3 ubiquitin-protein ligase MARCHF4-like [Xyrauchen texanus]|uniref:E3 ubiquitin-protein ligase MARCHF4-like n=1 Tax=Xyrauchen texanus TaxID=154827 RepID=UPI002241C9EA|nr:E3 ubiquitin-protein ligase MARCHF4-like [Xyrauchen texanus]